MLNESNGDRDPDAARHVPQPTKRIARVPGAAERITIAERGLPFPEEIAADELAAPGPVPVTPPEVGIRRTAELFQALAARGALVPEELGLESRTEAEGGAAARRGTAWPTSRLDEETRMATSEPVRWGLLATGGITKKLLAGAVRSSAVEVVAVGSRNRERAEAFAAERRIPHAYGTYEALLADPLVEAVYISLPNSLHHEWTLRSLAAGKHVLCEKPYSRTPAEVDAAYDAANAGGLVLSEGFMWRYHPQAEAMRTLLPELGDLQTIRATFSFVMDEGEDIRRRPDLNGGSLLDVGCYCVSGARYLAGQEPDLVFGVAEPGPSGVDVRFTGVLRFPSGVTAEFMSGFTTDHRGLEAIGTAGSALLTDPWQSLPATLVRNGVEEAFAPADPYQLEIENLSAAIRGEGEPLLGRADALGQARVLDALLRSAESGQPVRP